MRHLASTREQQAEQDAADDRGAEQQHLVLDLGRAQPLAVRDAEDQLVQLVGDVAHAGDGKTRDDADDGARQRQADLATAGQGAQASRIEENTQRAETAPIQFHKHG